MRRVSSSRAMCILLTCLAAASVAACGRRGPPELPPAATPAVPKTVSDVPPQVAAPAGGIATEPLGPAYQTSVPEQRVLPGTGRTSFPLDPLL